MSLEVKAGASPHFTIGAPDAWVETITSPSINKSSPKSTSFGAYFLLIDRQVKKEAGKVKTYYHLVKKITHVKGVEQNSSIEIEVDPLYEFITLHTIQVIRGNQVIQHLSADKIKVLQREKELEDNIYSGDKSLSIILDDIRVGDIIAYSYTRRNSNPLITDDYYAQISLSSNIPVERLRQRLLWPEELEIRNHNTPLKAKITSKEGYQEYLWDVRNLPEDKTDRRVPSWYDIDPFIEIGKPLNWQQVAQNASRSYASPPPLSKELHNYITQVRKQTKTKAERFIKVMRFVQDEIRYMGIEDRLDKIQPDDPSVVFKRRFGDCKDKTWLALTILKELGIEAYPALVHTRRGELLEGTLPSLAHFNHVIVAVFIDGKTYWIDPTFSLQKGDINHYTQPYYGLSLILREETTELVRMPKIMLSKPSYQLYEDIDVSRGKDAPGHLTVKRIYAGPDADTIRRTIASLDSKELAKEYLEIYQRYYSGAKEAKNLKVIDDEKNNQITVIGSYKIPNPWERDLSKERCNFGYYAEGFKDYLGRNDLIDRAHPLSLAFPVHDYKEIKIHLPDEGWDLPPVSHHLTHPSLNFKATENYHDGTLRITYDYKHLKDHIAAEDMDAYIKVSDKIRSILGGELYLWDQAPKAKPYHMSAIDSHISSVNWIMAFIVGLASLASAFGAFKLYRFKMVEQKTTSDPNFNRVKGWLAFFFSILVGEYLCVIAEVCLTFKDCVLSYKWLSLSIYKNTTINPQFLIILQGVDYVLTFVTAILGFPLLLLMLKKKRSFRPLFLRYILFYSLVTLIGFSSYYLLTQSPTEKRWMLGIVGFLLIKNLIQGCYVFRSKRVKAVFVHE